MANNTQYTHEINALTPAEIADKVDNIGVAKANLALVPLITLAILAGAFIAFGGMFYTRVVTESTLGAGPTLLLGGVAFSLGLILVIIAGAELFTGNMLITMAWADKKVSLNKLLRNWTVVYVGNLIGAVAIAYAVVWGGLIDAEPLAAKATAIAEGKLALEPQQAFIRGVLCNALVCLAVWMSFASRTVVGKVAVIVPPIATFVALGLEHSIANMYTIPVAMIAGLVSCDIVGLIQNIVFVTAGNMVGGALFVALSYKIIYLRN